MPVPAEYVDLLTDELAPFGLVFSRCSESPRTSPASERHCTVTFDADPESFVAAYDAADIEESYGDAWPPDTLRLAIDIDPDGDVTRIEFETHDLLDWAASCDPELGTRLNNVADPADQAQAVGTVLAAILTPNAASDRFDDW